MRVSDLHLWIRSETRATERRTPLVPADAATLVSGGAKLSVEESPTRVFAVEDYARAGCDVVTAGSWADAPSAATIVGIKELPDHPDELRHTHVFFAHAYKGQEGADELLGRFTRGGGELLDIEYLTARGRRVVAFGYWAGYVGAALAVLHYGSALRAPLSPTTKEELDRALSSVNSGAATALVIGARGRSGSGARDALEVAGWSTTAWGMADTRHLDKAALFDHDALVNCVVTHRPQGPFVTTSDVGDPSRRLSVIADVTCDVTSAHNVLPLNDAITSWHEPTRRFGGEHGAPVLDVIAIDNLPSLLPREASVSFSADFTPLWAHLSTRSGPFAASLSSFRAALS